mgnify:CR=1 FL=1
MVNRNRNPSPSPVPRLSRSSNQSSAPPRARSEALVAAWILGLLALLHCRAAIAADPKKQKAQPKLTFEADVLPILKAHCANCHSGAEPKKGLRLTSRRDLLRGGSSGSAIRIAAAESSLLWAKLASNEMPKEGQPLSAEEKGIIRTWKIGRAHV